MDDRNPYAPSSASLDGRSPRSQGMGSGVTAWRNVNILVMLPGSELPHRCVKCNEPADEPTKVRKVHWHAPAWYLLILLNIIIYAVVAAIVRKRALVAPGLCAAHKKRRRLGVAAAWIVLGLGLVLLFMGFSDQVSTPVVGAVGMLLILVSALVGIIASRILTARKIDENYVWLKGCGPEFLDSLPPLP
jgi:hypothetical protein